MWSGQPCRARAANDDFLEQSWFEMEVFTGSERRDSLMEPEISAGTDSSVGIYPSTILLVDDDPDIRSLTRTFLAHEGYSVLSSGDAERAVQIFRAVPQIDLLVTDLYMPGQSGMELARELKAMRPELPVLMISVGSWRASRKKSCRQWDGVFWLSHSDSRSYSLLSTGSWLLWRREGGVTLIKGCLRSDFWTALCLKMARVRVWRGIDSRRHVR